jgi:hypothetical protein
MRSEIPVAPPSINSFVNRKPFSPNDAEKIPSVIKKKSLINLFEVTLNS